MTIPYGFRGKELAERAFVLERITPPWIFQLDAFPVRFAGLIMNQRSFVSISIETELIPIHLFSPNRHSFDIYSEEGLADPQAVGNHF